MPSKEAQQYAEYFQSHLLGLKLCMLFDTEKIQKLNAGFAAQRLRLTVQATTGGLHDLEGNRVLVSEKEAITRFYTPKDKKAFDEALEIIRRSGFRAPRLSLVSMDIFRDNFTRTLLAKAKAEKTEAVRGVKFETSLGELIVDYLIKVGKSSHVIELGNSADLDALTGRAYRLSLVRKNGQVNSITLLAFPEVGQADLRINRLSQHFRDELGTWIRFMFEPGDDYTLTRPDYAKDLVDKVWQGFPLSP